MNYKKLRFRTGIVMISISVVIFLTLFAVPFMPLDAKLKITLGTIFIVAGEVLFWLGTILIGKEVYKKFMVMLKSGEWLNKKKEEWIPLAAGDWQLVTGNLRLATGN